MADTIADLAPTIGPAPIEVSVGGEGNLSAREAANALSQSRWKRDANPAAEPATEIPAEPEAAAQPEAGPGEQPAAVEADPAEQPPIEPPRSWTKEDKELFTGLPRETQERLAERERLRETDFSRRQNELAEQRKPLEAERSQLEQARKQYEEALPTLLATLQQATAGEFSDIKTMADVERLAREDWPRYALWDAQQKKIGAVQQEMTAAQQRQAQEFQTKWATFAKEEDAKFTQAAPEMANKETATKVANSSIELLKDKGFSDTDLGKLWNGEASLSLRDHRVQLLIRDAVRYRDAQALAKTKVSKPVPNVQRPGTAPQRAPDRDVQLAQLSKQLDQSGSWKDAARLLQAQRAARQ